MRRVRRFLALALVLSAILGITAVDSRALEDISTFPDITDRTVGEAVESLRTMGVLNGVGKGLFAPKGTLTRAEFCKMAVLTMGLGDQVKAYESRTIFPDVAYKHWARGYINLAVNTEVDGARLILGVGDGNFAPGRVITFAEAVTVILRILGYGEEANRSWPSGAMSAASTLGLTRDLGRVTASGAITRAQAALLFRNMLCAETNGGTDIYAASLGSAVKGAILTSVSARTPAGEPAVELAGQLQPVAVSENVPAAFFLGKRGTAVMDKSGKFLTLLPDTAGEGRTFAVEYTTATGIVGTDGTSISVAPGVKVLRGDEESTWAEAFVSLNKPGLRVTVYLTASGEADYIFVESLENISGKTAVAASAGLAAFDAILTGSNCAIVKNGCTVGAGALAKGDVGLYDAGSNTLYVSDFRIMAIYEKASPSPMAPTKVTLFGKEFEVADCAIETIGSVQVGSPVVASFSPDGKVAKLSPLYSQSVTALGVVKAESTGSDVTLELINAPAGLETVSGTLPDEMTAEELLGGVYTFTVSRMPGGPVVIYPYEAAGGAVGYLDPVNRMLGSAKLADNAAIFERVGWSSALQRVSMASLGSVTVPYSKVLYAHYNSAGCVDVVTLDDVTGDNYVYGLVTTRTEIVDYIEPDEDDEDAEEGEEKEPTPVECLIITVTNSQGSVEAASPYGGWPGMFAGIAVSGESAGPVGGFRMASGISTLSSVSGATQDSFSLKNMTFYHGGVSLTISPNVQCYDRRTQTWFASLEECLVYSNSFTVYYDELYSGEGRIRVIVTN